MEFPKWCNYLSVRDTHPGPNRVGIIFVFMILSLERKERHTTNRQLKDKLIETYNK